MEEESEVRRRISKQRENRGVEDLSKQRSESAEEEEQGLRFEKIGEEKNEREPERFQEEGKRGEEVEMKKEEAEEGRKLKDEKLEVVKNLLLGAIIMEKILTLYVESSQNIVWGREAAWDCWVLPGTTGAVGPLGKSVSS